MVANETSHNQGSRFSSLNDPGLLRNLSYVNGEWMAGEDGREIVVSDPADAAVIGAVSVLSARQSQLAVEAAQAAFLDWSNRLPQERSAILKRWFELMNEHKSDLAFIMTLEQGKPLSESLGEIDYAASFLEFYAEESKRPNIESVTSHLKGAEVEIWREPVGVAGLITPWNFPSAMLTRKAGAALAAGCTVVAHPSNETPFSALALAELAERAGMPKGVFNVINGHAPEIVKPWMETPTVRAVSFTGSTEVGRILYQQSAPTIKRLVMELGGHAPFIVFAGADIDQTVEEAIKAKFATSGQDCLGANRFFVERSVYKEFCEKFTAATMALRVGKGLDDPDIGPLMNAGAIAKQYKHVEDAVEKGARLLTGGSRHELGPLFFQPTVLADVPANALIMSEETFGPVAALVPFDDEDEVIARANDTEYGLVAYVHSNDPKRIYRLTRALQYGMVAVNRSKVTGAPIPFGGMKQSGIGREGARLGMEAFTEVKYVCRDWA
jgi:aspartate-semialdehyde dehydrogenase